MAGINISLEDNPVLASFLFYATAVVLKMMFMSTYTAFLRLTKNIFVNPEDCAIGSKPGKKLTPVANNPDVERIRRCHLNDIENIIAFVLIGLLYTFTGPDLFMAKLHFRIFAGSRFFHSVAYLLPIPQPTRALAFFVGYVCTISMAVTVLKQATF